jgi:hypothetical protein
VLFPATPQRIALGEFNFFDASAMIESSEIRSRVEMSDSDIIDHFARLGLDITIEELVFTSETVEDFVLARERLCHHRGNVERYEAQGILVVSEAQPKISQLVRDSVVVSLFYARVVMGVLPTALVDSDYPGYARLWVEGERH